MKKISFITFLAVMLSCSAVKQAAPSWQSAVVESPCAPKTECLFETFKDKSLQVKTDDTGHTYFNLITTPGKMVHQYTYRTITDPNLMDAGYSETVTFESDGTPASLNHKGTAIQTTKMMLNVQCFCRGKAGIYKIDNGTLTYSGNKLNIEIPQIVDGQVTKKVSVALK